MSLRSNADVASERAGAAFDVEGSMALGAEEIHLWWCDLDVPPTRLERFADVLASDERARASRFRSSRDGNRYVVARGTLRCLLPQYEGIPPAALRFAYGAQGKPLLALEHTTLASRLHFNLSHSGARALYAVTRAHRIGVDVEAVRELASLAPLTEQVLSPGERAALERVYAPERPEAFLQIWTGKEAVAKAIGLGLSLLLGTLPCGLHRVARSRSVVVVPVPGAGTWYVQAVDVEAGYVASLAAERAGLTVRRMWETHRARIRVDLPLCGPMV